MNFLKDLWGFMKHRKKFWLLPLILILWALAHYVICRRLCHRTVYLFAVLIGPLIKEQEKVF